MKRIIQCIAAAMIAVASPLTLAQQAGTDKVFQELGGKQGIRKFVGEFMEMNLADPRIKHTFDDADIDRLTGVLTDQFCMLTGGPCTYDGENMKDAHADMKLTNAHFNALTENLQEAMIRNGVPYSAQYALIAKLAPMQRDVVTK